MCYIMVRKSVESLDLSQVYVTNDFGTGVLMPRLLHPRICIPSAVEP